MGRFTPAVLGIVILAALAFLAGSVLPNGQELFITKGAFWYPANPAFAVWQPLTYLFLHDGLGHIAFNMLALVSFGVPLERQWGTRRFLVFYLLCGLGAGFVQVGINAYQFGVLHQRLIAAGIPQSTIDTLLATGETLAPSEPALRSALLDLYHIYATPMIGASGAIYGTLVAFGLLYPNAKLMMIFLPVPIAAKYFIPLLLALDLLSGVTGFPIFGGGVAHFAHIGGALIGFLLMLLWRRRARPGGERGFAAG
ncbi:rhomboid family intramembrane serine protease [Opitutaceae bacterium EW11]|nr:rhomboid family intramembrane serine protease [Opitutaceae bacterium EW11]